MMLPDLINGSFEFLGGFAILLHIKQLLKDKSVRGVSWGAFAFFFTWGLWNLFYYPHLNQMLSFYGGLFIVVANAVWLGIALKYRENNA